MDQVKMALVQLMLTRNLQSDIANAREILGHMVQGLTPDQQKFIFQHWRTSADFLKSEHGKKAVSVLADSWMEFVTNP